MSNFHVIFTENNARIYQGECTDHKETCIHNPNLNAVAGIPPHLWKVVNGKIVPMTNGEMVVRQEDVDTRGAINDISTVPPAKLPTKSFIFIRKNWKPIVGALLGSLVTYLITKGVL